MNGVIMKKIMVLIVCLSLLALVGCKKEYNADNGWKPDTSDKISPKNSDNADQEQDTISPPPALPEESEQNSQDIKDNPTPKKVVNVNDNSNYDENTPPPVPYDD